MNNPNYRDKGSTLSKFIWELKDEGVNFQIKWRIVDRAPKYNPRTRKCALCVKEAYYINYHRHMATLNKRSEIFSTCRHRNMETLSNVWRQNLFFIFIYISLFKVNYFILFLHFPFSPTLSVLCFSNYVYVLFWFLFSNLYNDVMYSTTHVNHSYSHWWLEMPWN